MSVKELNLKNLEKADELLSKELQLMERKINTNSSLDYFDKEVRNDYCSMLKQAKNFIRTTIDMENNERYYDGV